MTTTVLTDVGTVVELYLGGTQDRVDQATVDDTFLTPPIGVMLTNAVSPDDGNGGYTGGYCVVGCSDPMVVRLVSTSGQPAAGAKLYLQKSDGTAGGASDAAVLDSSYNGPCPLGYCLPVGPTGATRLRYMTWEPEPPNGMTVRRGANLVITSSTTPADFATAPVKSGRRYIIEAELFFTCDVAGGVDVGWSVSAASYSDDMVNADVFGTTPVSYLAGDNGLSPAGIGAPDRVGGIGLQSGHACIRGVFIATADFTVGVWASQDASSGNPTTIRKESWFRVTEV